MKRLGYIILCVFLMFSTIACNHNEENIQEPAQFYYCTSEDNSTSVQPVISHEIREIKQCEKDIYQILELYLSGPQSDHLVSPFPAGVQLISVQQDDNKVFILLSPTFSQLTGFDLSVACACLSLTIFDLTEYDDISIRAHENLLDGSESIDLSREDLLLTDDTLIQEDS